MLLETFDYDFLNVYNSTQSPSTVHASNTDMGKFFRRYLFQKATSVLKFGLPKNFDLSYFLYSLYACGYVGIVKTGSLGVVPQCGNAGGELNLYYNPKNFYPIKNSDDIDYMYNIHYGYLPDIKTGKDCVLLRLTPDYRGIVDIVGLYADSMAILWENLGLNAINSKLAYIFLTKSKSFAEGIKKMYDQIQKGSPMVVVDRQLLDEDGRSTWDVFTQDLKNNFISGDILDVIEKLEHDFDSEIGIPSSGSKSKKAQMSNDEVALDNAGTYSKCELWLEQLQRDIDVCNEFFKDELLSPISVTLRYNRNDDYTEIKENEVDIYD